jgi:hypothetical protein
MFLARRATGNTSREEKTISQQGSLRGIRDACRGVRSLSSHIWLGRQQPGPSLGANDRARAALTPCIHSMCPSKEKEEKHRVLLRKHGGFPPLRKLTGARSIVGPTPMLHVLEAD